MTTNIQKTNRLYLYNMIMLVKFGTKFGFAVACELVRAVCGHANSYAGRAHHIQLFN